MNIRNFCIIAHIDHGKSTLADRLIEFTGTRDRTKMKDQLLDTLDLERERGITIKLQPVRMKLTGELLSELSIEGMDDGCILNLIDTPGHTDFRYEVGRSLAAVEGAILLVDATQGIQAQTLAVLSMAREHNLTIIPVLNKIDLDFADPDTVSKEIEHILQCDASDILRISAKAGLGIGDVVREIVKKVSPPTVLEDQPSRALIFDALLDPYRGVIAFVRVTDGCLRKSQKMYLPATQTSCEIQEVGHLSPERIADTDLASGQIGYVVTGLKDRLCVRVGDTIVSNQHIDPLPGYSAMQPVIFASFYPSDKKDLPHLKDSIEKYALSDPAFEYMNESHRALGMGFRCGFLGMLHMEIVQMRLEREEGCDLVVTAPSVEYEVLLATSEPAKVVRSSLLMKDNPQIAHISNPADLPDPTVISEIREPWVSLEVISRNIDISSVMKLLEERRGLSTATETLEHDRVLLVFQVPLAGVVMDLFDALKSATEGYGSMSYTFLDNRVGDLVKLQILLLGEPVDALSLIVPRKDAEHRGKAIVKKLKEVLPRHQFVVPIQAAVGGKILARETVAALRKDVTGHLYGGDVTRKQKLLKKQKAGKKRMKNMGKVTLPQEAFMSLLAR